MPKKYIHSFGLSDNSQSKPIPFKQWKRDSLPVVAVLQPPSRVKAKKDRHAVQMHRIHGTKYHALPDYAMRNAGHVNRFNGEIQTIRQF